MSFWGLSFYSTSLNPMIESARQKRVKRLLRELSAEIETNPVEVINSFLLEWLAAHDGPVQLLYFLKT